jgi:hypothetical protein
LRITESDTASGQTLSDDVVCYCYSAMLGWTTPMLSTYDLSYVFALVNIVYTTRRARRTDTGNAGLPGVPTKLMELVVLRPRRALNTKGVETVSN